MQREEVKKIYDDVAYMEKPNINKEGFTSSLELNTIGSEILECDRIVDDKIFHEVDINRYDTETFENGIVEEYSSSDSVAIAIEDMNRILSTNDGYSYVKNGNEENFIENSDKVFSNSIDGSNRAKKNICSRNTLSDDMKNNIIKNIQKSVKIRVAACSENSYILSIGLPTDFAHLDDKFELSRKYTVDIVENTKKEKEFELVSLVIRKNLERKGMESSNSLPVSEKNKVYSDKTNEKISTKKKNGMEDYSGQDKAFESSSKFIEKVKKWGGFKKKEDMNGIEDISEGSVSSIRILDIKKLIGYYEKLLAF